MAPWLLAAAYETCERLRHVWADMAYRGQRLRAWVEDECGWTLEIVELGLVPDRCGAAACASLHRVAAPLGGRTHDRLDPSVPPLEQRV